MEGDPTADRSVVQLWRDGEVTCWLGTLMHTTAGTQAPPTTIVPRLEPVCLVKLNLVKFYTQYNVPALGQKFSVAKITCHTVPHKKCTFQLLPCS